MGHPDDLGVGGEGAAIQGAPPDGHRLARPSIHSSHLDTPPTHTGGHTALKEYTTLWKTK